MANKTKLSSVKITEPLVNNIIPQMDNKVNGKIKLISNKKLNILNTITKKFKSQKDFKFHLAEKITEYKKDLLLINGDNKFKPARPVDVFNVIKNYIPLKYIKNISKSSHISYEFYIQDYDDPYGLYKPLQLENLISKIAIYYEIPNIIQTIKDVSIRLNNVDPEDTIFKPLNLPPKHINLYKNSVINLKTMEYSHDINQFGSYDFISMSEFNIKAKSEVNKLHYEIVQRIMNDWSESDPEKLLFLQQLAFAALDGNGRQSFVILIGSGGNGKSTFLNILENLAGTNYTSKLNIQDMLDDNKLIDVNESTKLIVGHDLATQTKLSNALTSRFKELVTGEAFKVNVKYKDARLLKTYGLKIQSTNTLLDIFENTDAMRRRIKLFNWTNKNFTKLTDEDLFNLDDLVGSSFNGKPNNDFYEAFIAYILEHVEYFNKFTVVKEIEEATDSMINNSDAVYNFLEWFNEQELNLFNKFPIIILYELYKTWHWQNNPKGVPLKQRLFTERLKVLLNNFGFKLSDKQTRLTALSLLEFNLEFINEHYMNNQLKDFNKRTKFNYILTDKNINEDDLNNFKLYEKLSVDDLSTKELIMLDYLIQQGNTEAILLKNCN